MSTEADEAAKEFASLLRLLAGLKGDAMWAFNYCQVMSGIASLDAASVLTKGEAALAAKGELDGPPIGGDLSKALSHREAQRLVRYLSQ
ncbi:MAG: hypothetical protein ACRERC_21890 [Candidatus Binatia bacterium]